MPAFNPNEPATDSELKSAPVRDNFNALKALIDAIPAGPPGPQGDPGPQGPPGPGSSGASCQIQIADGNGQFASDSTFYFIQGSGWTSLRCNWPTSDPAIAGALWNNNGILNISAG